MVKSTGGLSATEETLLAIWREVLDHRDLDTQSNFFEAGGDSIRVVEVVSRCKASGLDVDLEQFFDCPTVGAIAAAIDAQ